MAPLDDGGGRQGATTAEKERVAHDRIQDAVARMRRRVDVLEVDVRETPAQQRRRMLQGVVIRQLPLPPHLSSIEPPPSLPELDEPGMPGAHDTSKPLPPLVSVRSPRLPWPLRAEPPAVSHGTAARQKASAHKPASPRHARLSADAAKPASERTRSPLLTPRHPFYPHDMLPLDVFNPEEPPGERALGGKAHSRYVGVDGSCSWQPCTVTGYDPLHDLYRIVWTGRAVSCIAIAPAPSFSHTTHHHRPPPY
jgi:hypothetical protein